MANGCVSFFYSAQVVLKPDLEATSFSAQNAYFFAKLSTIAYMPMAEAEGVVKGSATEAGLGFDRFHWFQVRYIGTVYLRYTVE